MERIAVSSSNIASVGYDSDSLTLEIEFNNGGIYQYYSVPENIYTDLLNAGSVGSYFSHNIRNSYPTQKI
ncbi:MULTISPECIES: KTSC domain-containing protein [Pectobacterium]|uniref:KTSC domain-containing protein n=1 Tax=Pectobacterium TaxID=122277 RepID=UPI000A47FD58|nr:KTSC domain-containing protein [Pectobacterium polaris]MCU1793243.1 KTSC domain-containing protein [Pectobacterium polaris]